MKGIKVSGTTTYRDVLGKMVQPLPKKWVIIETVNEDLKNIAQIELLRHRRFDNFMFNLLGAFAAYSFFPKEPTLRVQTVDCTYDRPITLF